MKGRITFLVITSKTGKQRRFSIHKSLIYCIVLFSVFLLASGILGALKYRENSTLKKQCALLEAEKNKMEAVARTVKAVEQEALAIRKLLGLESSPVKEEAR
ncbi:MAG: hypothetical protein WCQ99_09600 [Pseudomonadota bacterium]